MLDSLFSQFSDSTFYFMLGATGTALFSIRAVLMLVFGVDHGGDFDLHVGDHAGGAEHSGFSLFSMLSIVAFMMGTGWMGLACRSEWQLNSLLSALIACGFGFSLMFGTSAMMWQMRRFDQPGGYDVRKCIGQTGRVYLAIPAKGGGMGQVELNVDGRRTVLPAVSDDPPIPSFASVKVLSLKDDNQTLVVTPA